MSREFWYSYTWRTLLQDATTKPGTLSAAYSAFHRYSIGNQLLAMFQCAVRELPRSLREVEAGSVAYILTGILGLPGRESARAYIQGWLRGDDVPEASARRIFGAAQEIMAAGTTGGDHGRE